MVGRLAVLPSTSSKSKVMTLTDICFNTVNLLWMACTAWKTYALDRIHAALKHIVARAELDGLFKGFAEKISDAAREDNIAVDIPF